MAQSGEAFKRWLMEGGEELYKLADRQDGSGIKGDCAGV